MKGKKTVQFDRSVDIQKDEMRRERAAKEAERIRQTIEDSRTNAALRSANDPPAFQGIPQHEFLHPGDYVAEKSFNNSLRACAPPSFSLPPPSPIGSRRPSLKSPLAPKFAGSGSSRQSFSDSLGSQRWRTDSYKTALCHEWRDNQTCQYGECCRYAHGIHELRPPIQASAYFLSYFSLPF